jgi:MFS family permease
VPLALTEVRGLAATLAGLPLTVAALAWTAGSWLQDREATRRSHRALVGGGLAAILVGVVGVASVLSPAVPTWHTGVAWGVASFGMGVAYSTATLVILERASPGREGEASAALQLASMLGTALGTGVGGALLNAVTRRGLALPAGIAAVDAVMAAVAVVGLVVSRRIPKGARDDPSPARRAPERIGPQTGRRGDRQLVLRGYQGFPDRGSPRNPRAGGPRERSYRSRRPGRSGDPKASRVARVDAVLRGQLAILLASGDRLRHHEIVHLRH